MSKPRRVVLLLIYAAFVSMGLPDGILGAAWPQMRAELRLDLNENWPMLALGSCGSALSSFLSGAALRRLGVGRVLLVTTFLTASVVLGYSLGATFGVIAGLAFFLGLGNGAISMRRPKPSALLTRPILPKRQPRSGSVIDPQQPGAKTFCQKPRQSPKQSPPAELYETRIRYIMLTQWERGARGRGARRPRTGWRRTPMADPVDAFHPSARRSSPTRSLAVWRSRQKPERSWPAAP